MLSMEIEVGTGYNRLAKVHYAAKDTAVSIRDYDAPNDIHTRLNITVEDFEKICEEFLLIRQRENGRAR